MLPRRVVSASLYEVGLERNIHLESPYSHDASRAIFERGRPKSKSTDAVRAPLMRLESVEVLEYVGSNAPQAQLYETEECRGGNESLTSFSHRFGWLVALLIMQSLSSFVLTGFEKLILDHPVIILFLTMLVGAGGNAGSQSAVLAIRAIAKGTFNPHVSLKAFVWHELWTGLRLAAILTLVSFVRVWLFDSDLVEVCAICVAMFVIVISAVAIGTLMPLTMWWMGLDPAHAGAAIQVSVDILGVTSTCVISSIVFSLAASFLSPQPSLQLPEPTIVYQ